MLDPASLDKPKESREMTMKDEITMETRVRELERCCKRLRFWCLASPALALSACLAAAVSQEPKTVRAQEFLLLGPDGIERGSLKPEGDGAVLLLGRADGSSQVVLQAGEDDSGLSLQHGDWSTADLLVSDEQAVLILEGGEETFSVAELGAAADGSAMSVSWNDEYEAGMASYADEAIVRLTAYEKDANEMTPENELSVIVDRESLQALDLASELFSKP